MGQTSSSVSDLFDWVRRARRLIPREDRRVLLSPPRLLARFVRFALTRHAGRAGAASASDILARDSELGTLILDFFRLAARGYFRARTEGVENVPAQGPVLLVGNHNGGLVPTDGFLTWLAIHDHFGPSRAVFALTHDFLFEDPLLRKYALKLGMIRAGHDSARQAFAAGGVVLVYPGSDLDTYRTFRQRGKIVLAGRKGFIKLALRAGVPIVPVVSAGTHEQFIVLSRGDRLARALHAHEWGRTQVLPWALGLPWGFMPGFVPYIPLPAQTTVAFGKPIRWPDLGADDAGDPEVLERCYQEVEGTMQTMLDRLSVGRRFLLGQKSGSLSPAAGVLGPAK